MHLRPTANLPSWYQVHFVHSGKLFFFFILFRSIDPCMVQYACEGNVGSALAALGDAWHNSPVASAVQYWGSTASHLLHDWFLRRQTTSPFCSLAYSHLSCFVFAFCFLFFVFCFRHLNRCEFSRCELLSSKLCALAGADMAARADAIHRTALLMISNSKYAEVRNTNICRAQTI